MAYETGDFANIDDRAVDAVSSLDDLALLLTRLHEDYKQSGHEKWENNTLDRYLDALAALATDLGEDRLGRPTWHAVARLLVSATGYEYAAGTQGFRHSGSTVMHPPARRDVARGQGLRPRRTVDGCAARDVAKCARAPQVSQLLLGRPLERLV